MKLIWTLAWLLIKINEFVSDLFMRKDDLYQLKKVVDVKIKLYFLCIIIKEFFHIFENCVKWNIN